MRIALVAPSDTACTSNAGAHMITAGIRQIVQDARRDASFVIVDMLQDHAEQWAAARACDAVILCGNPRFSVSDFDAWWECGIWDRISACMDAGVRVIDGWGGACVGLDVPDDLDDQVQELLAIPRTRRVLKVARRLHGAITRDPLAARLYRLAGVEEVHEAPCSSWFARWNLGFRWDEHASTVPAAIILLAMRGHEWAPEALQRLAANLADEHGTPAPFVATCWDDYAWAEEVGLQPVLPVMDPQSLLRLYARTERLVSFRIHASIPAASLHRPVCTLAVDTRVSALAPFGLPAQPFTEIRSPEFAPRFGEAREPDYSAIVSTMRNLLTC
jgi:hypothetical protein